MAKNAYTAELEFINSELGEVAVALSTRIKALEDAA